MLILILRTDKPEAEIGLYDNDKQLAYTTWQAHRQLVETLNLKIKEVLEANNKELKELGGILIYKGPGSFTGLRIGISVANALADSLGVQIAGTTGEKWLEEGVHRLQTGTNDKLVMPEYGAPPHITQQKH